MMDALNRFPFDDLLMAWVTSRPQKRAVASSSIRLFALLAAVWIALALVANAPAVEIDLSSKLRPGQVQQVTSVVEIRGELTTNADGQQVRRMPMQAKADLRYHEKLLASPSSSGVRAIRNYSRAQADIRIRENEFQQKLREDRCLIVSDLQESATLFSPRGPLTREELDLIDAPGSSACLDLLLPDRSVTTGGKWRLTDLAVSRLLGLDAVGHQDITGTLAKIEDGLAIIELAGTASGAAGGVSTEIELQGKANYHLQRRNISWLAIQYHEKRAIGHAQPGYDATIRVRVQTEPAQDVAELADRALANSTSKTIAAQSLLEFQAQRAGIEFLQDRRWRVMVDRFDTVILRLVDRGELIAQCNITRLPALATGKPLSLAEFQSDVEQTLGKNLGQIVEATQFETASGLRALRITVSGTASELPIQWVYYHVSDTKGQRVSLVFTMEAKLVERFAQIDRELVESLRLVPVAIDDGKDPNPASTDPTSARREKSGSGAK